jgi:hypothetical protein
MPSEAIVNSKCTLIATAALVTQLLELPDGFICEVTAIT